MNILILNWRDIKNPKGGGAEVLTHEMAKRWVQAGHTVTQFAENFLGAQKGEIVDGVRIIRGGSADIRKIGLPVHAAAFFWYLRQERRSIDVVVDEIHGIPFFTPWYVRQRKVALLCEVAGRIWKVAFRFPGNFIGPFIEKHYFRFYNNIHFLTISPSTQKELLLKGIKRNDITVLPMGLTLPQRIKIQSKEKSLTLIFVARLTKAKGIEDVLKTLAILKKTYPKVHLWIVGQGEQVFMRKIVAFVNRWHITDNVKFFGFVDQNKKFELMSKAHLLLVPSVKEGWGLTVPESGSVGTPSVAYDVEGLRDVIVNRKTGILTKPTPEDMSRAIVKVVSDRFLYERLQKGARRLSSTYSWDKTAQAAMSVLQET